MPGQVPELTRSTLPAAEAEIDVWRFADALAFNWLIGGTDAMRRTAAFCSLALRSGWRRATTLHPFFRTTSQAFDRYPEHMIVFVIIRGLPLSGGPQSTIA